MAHTYATASSYDPDRNDYRIGDKQYYMPDNDYHVRKLRDGMKIVKDIYEFLHGSVSNRDKEYMINNKDRIIRKAEYVSKYLNDTLITEQEHKIKDIKQKINNSRRLVSWRGITTNKSHAKRIQINIVDHQRVIEKINELVDFINDNLAKFEKYIEKIEKERESEEVRERKEEREGEEEDPEELDGGGVRRKSLRNRRSRRRRYTRRR